MFQSPSFKFSRKASSSYSLKLEPPNKQNKVKTKRKPLSTPASPSRSREPQCTCMTADQYARLRAQDPRYRGTHSNLRSSNLGTGIYDCNRHCQLVMWQHIPLCVVLKFRTIFDQLNEEKQV